MNISGLILAAGDSSRLGQPKQLLRFGQHSLIQHIEQQLAPLCDHLWVVLGHQHALIAQQLQRSNTVLNPDWQLGMGHSIKTGISQLPADTDGVLIALCDQPHISQTHYQQMLDQARQNPQAIISSYYQQQAGVPVWFPATLFSKLLKIDDQQGARKIISQFTGQHISLPCPAATLDIDTPEQLSRLSRSEGFSGHDG